jgi:hypothetical protein
MPDVSIPPASALFKFFFFFNLFTVFFSIFERPTKHEEMSEPEQKRARQEARAECRAAARAAERANWLGHSDEINKLLAQINEIDRDPDVITTTEYKLITARLRQREQ